MRGLPTPGFMPGSAGLGLLGLLLLLTTSEGPGLAAAKVAPPSACGGVEWSTRAASEYYTIPLVPTARGAGTSGMASVRFASSPFGVAVTEDGRYTYDLHVRASGLRPVEGRAYVAWVTTPNLDQVVRLGPLDEALEVTGRVEWNKYLVVVSAESSEPGDRWAGPIVLRGLSLSGMLESMAGHGPLDTEECYYMGFESGMRL
jgi:hypothetical protein